jgi:hypothetical protein
MNLYLAIQLEAMRAVRKQDSEYSMRSIRRWYSREFHTPLVDVADIPDEDVLQAFFEDKYDSMEEADREVEVARLLETEEERLLKAREKDEEDAEAFEFDKFSEEKLKKLEAKAPEASLLTTGPTKDDKFKAIGKAVGKAVGNSSELEEDVKISFLGPDDFEAEIQRLSLVQPSKKG